MMEILLFTGLLGMERMKFLNKREKLVVALVGYEINLVTFKIKGIHFTRIFLEK